MHERLGWMKGDMEEERRSTNMSQLKRSLEKAEIMRSGIELVLMIPFLDSMRKGEYEEALSKLNDEIRELKIIMDEYEKDIPEGVIDEGLKRE